MRASAYRMKLPTWATRLIQVLVILLIVYAVLRLTGFNIIIEGATDMTGDADAMAATLKKTMEEAKTKAKELSKKV